MTTTTTTTDDNEGDDRGDELLEAMDALVEKFGADRCHFAVEICRVRCGGVGGRTTRQWEDDETVCVDDISGEMGFLKHAALWYCGNAKTNNNSGASRNKVRYNVDMSRTPSRIELLALRWTAAEHNHAHHHLQQAPKEDKDTDGKPETIMQSPSKWDTLTLRNFDDSEYEELLNDILIVDMFESIVVDGSFDTYGDGTFEADGSWIKIASALGKIYQRGNVKSLKLLMCRFCVVSIEEFRKDFLDVRGCLPRTMTFHNFEFADDDVCSRMIGQGLEESQKQGNVRLEALYFTWRWTRTPTSLDGIINSLGCITTLKRIDFEDGILGSTVQLLAERVLMHPLSRLESLTFHWKIEEDNGDEKRQAEWEIFCSAVEQSHSLRRLKILSDDFNRSDDTRLLQFAFSLRNRLEHFSFSSSLGHSFNKDHSSAYDWCTDLMAQPKTSNTESYESADSSSSGFPLPARCLGIHRYRDPDGLSHSEILFWRRQISSHRLAYVCDLDCNVDEMWQNRYTDRRTEEEINNLQLLRLWLERNRVGRALLLPQVSNLVPAGLWPLVLAKASTKQQQQQQQQGMNVHPSSPPFDGIFFLVQGMAQAGHLLRAADPDSKTAGRIR